MSHNPQIDASTTSRQSWQNNNKMLNGKHDDTASCKLQSLPLCMVTLNVHDLKPTAINDTFLDVLGPLYKFSGYSFVSAASDDKNSDSKDRFQKAIDQALENYGEHGGGDRVRVRNIEMTTLAGESGFPIRRFFDWFIKWNGDELVLLGDPCSDQDVKERGKDAELIDFFQNAPIALHWLSGEGKVIWANQTELNVLGYTAEEYIGQDIMKFCPDEEELVLEIFKQLGSGNAIKDVPVRFRTKDGKIVHLLIDSNVRYEKDGSFGHTRCFIRDDTGRKIREARAELLLEETKRSLKMLDNFVARALHHMRTPLHVTQQMVDYVGEYFMRDMAKETDNSHSPAECMDMVNAAADQIAKCTAFLDDVADLVKFDQGRILHINPKIVYLENFGKEILKDIPDTQPGVSTVLELCQGDCAGLGPSMAFMDPNVLRRILIHLLKNAVEVTKFGSVALGIGYKNGRLTFTVSDTGPGLEMPANAAEGDLPIIFQRYHQEFVPNKAPDLQSITDLREKIQEGIKSHNKNSMGIGLSLSYHLVEALGGELRYTLNKQNEGYNSKFHFSLPKRATFNTTIALTPHLVATRIKRTVQQQALISTESTSTTHMTSDDVSSLSIQSDYEGSRNSSTSSFKTPVDFIPEIPASKLAAQGIKSKNSPSILVVEDTEICAKLLCRTLSRSFNCATKWAENGKMAVDILFGSAPGMYDLVLMDLRMPVMDGLEATRIIKKELGIKIPVIALTGEDNESTRKEADQIGFDAFYGKPTKRADLKAILKRFTGYEVK